MKAKILRHHQELDGSLAWHFPCLSRSPSSYKILCTSGGEVSSEFPMQTAFLAGISLSSLVSDPPKELSSAEAWSLCKSKCASMKERSWELTALASQHLPCTHNARGAGSGSWCDVLIAFLDSEVSDHAVCQHFRNIRMLIKLTSGG